MRADESGLLHVTSWPADAANLFDQLVIPGMKSLVDPHRVRDRLKGLPTRFLFTYGQSEVGTYRIEAEQGLTCQFLARVEAVQCESNEGGHIFPSDRIREFLDT
jgi:hypothetical protein